jgi:hypothetical protein
MGASLEFLLQGIIASTTPPCGRLSQGAGIARDPNWAIKGHLGYEYSFLNVVEGLMLVLELWSPRALQLTIIPYRAYLSAAITRQSFDGCFWHSPAQHRLSYSYQHRSSHDLDEKWLGR